MSSKITINGKTYFGNNVSVVNNRVYIDGVLKDDDLPSGIVKLVVEGTLNHLECDASVEAQQITGDVTAGGSIKCGDVGGNVNAGGSVKAGKVSGSVMAGGSVRTTA